MEWAEEMLNHPALLVKPTRPKGGSAGFVIGSPQQVHVVMALLTPVPKGD